MVETRDVRPSVPEEELLILVFDTGVALVVWVSFVLVGRSVYFW